MLAACRAYCTTYGPRLTDVCTASTEGLAAVDAEQTSSMTHQLQALYTVLDIPLDQGLELGGLEGVGVGGFALHSLVPGHHVIPEEHAQNVSNAAVMRYAGLHKVSQHLDPR